VSTLKGIMTKNVISISAQNSVFEAADSWLLTK
jgi:hypothetical protein